MRIFKTSRFSREARRVPRHLRATVEERASLFQKNPFDSRLKTHKLTGNLKDFWSFSVDFHLRILFEFTEDRDALFHSIGDHTIYD